MKLVMKSSSRTIDRLALSQVIVGSACEKTVAVASDNTFDVAVPYG
jgi:hypothetical protein